MLKLLAIALLTCCTLWICEADERDGWKDLLTRLKIGDPELGVSPTIEDAVFGDESFEIKITNTSSESMAYHGYSPDDPQVFTREFVNGEWRPSGWSWCGTGLGAQLMEPGESVTFVFDRHLEERQLFVVFRMSENRSSLIQLRDPHIKSATKAERKSAPNKATMPIRSRDESEDPFK